MTVTHCTWKMASKMASKIASKMASRCSASHYPPPLRKNAALSVLFIAELSSRSS